MKTFADYGIDVRSSASGETYTTCPECSSQRRKKKAKCLGVNVEKGTWICHHCGWKGGLGEGADRVRVPLHWRKPKYRKPEPKPATELPRKVVDWFAERDISEQTLAACGIDYGPVYMPQVEDFVNAVIFPYYRAGELVNRKYRDGNKNFRLEAGCERTWYGLDDAAERTVVVEGEIDRLACVEAGVTAVLSVPDGAPPPGATDYSSKFDFIAECAEQTRCVKQWVLAVDSDEPGRSLEDELGRRLGRENCLRVRWPDGCKDANETLQRFGANGLRECLDAAEPYPIKGVFEVLDLSDKIDHLYQHGYEKGHSTGFANLDGIYTVRPGEWTAVTGIPNSGKSNFLDAMAVRMARQHGWRFAVFSPENQPLEDHMARIIEKHCDAPFDTGPTERITPDQLRDAKRWANDHFRWILPDEDDEWTLDTVLQSARELVKRHGIRGLIIDPWNELEHQRPRDMSETEYVSSALKKVRQFARRNGVHVWLVAHPAKLYKDKDGQYPVPTLYDISGSAHWRNKADNGLVIWRDFADTDSSVIEVHTAKIRFKQIGQIGSVEMVYNRVTGNYRPRDRVANWGRTA